MTVVSFSMAYRSFWGGSGRLDTHLDTPPSINRRHLDSCLAPAPSRAGVLRELCLNGDFQSLDQIVDGVTECGQLRVVGFGDIDLEPLAESRNQIEEIHR